MKRVCAVMLILLVSITYLEVVEASAASLPDRSRAVQSVNALALRPNIDPYLMLSAEYRIEVPATEENLDVIGSWYLHLDPLLRAGKYQLRSKNLRVIETGYYVINADQITFYDTRCADPDKQQPIPGVYAWQLKGSALILKALEDNCPTRRSLELTKSIWVRELYRVVK